MKKGIILLFSGLLMYNSIGFIINFHFVLADWQYEMKTFLSQNIEDDALTQLTFHKSDFKEGTHEFSRNKERFDVVKTIEKGDSILVYCYKDHVETELAAEFNALLLQNTTTNGDLEKKMARVFKQIFNDYVFDNTFLVIKSPPSVFYPKKTVLSKQTPFLSSAFRDILTPPPQGIILA